MRSTIAALASALLLSAMLIDCGGGNQSSSPVAASPPAVIPPPSVTPTPPSQPGTADVLTYHNDAARTGQNLNETQLTPGNVNQAHFGKLAVFPTDGKIDAQPLIVSNFTVNGVVRNVLYAATEHDTVYAFDADTGTQLWKTSLLQSGESPSDARNCSQVVPEIGVTATPVIDRGRSVIYVVAMSKNASGTVYYQRLHALSLTSGAEMLGGPTTVPAALPGQSQSFDPGQYKERAALLIANGAIYTAWTSHCDIESYGSWVITFDPATLKIAQIFNGEPSAAGGEGSFWSSGSGPLADTAGNVYLLSANGSFGTTLDANGFPQNRDYGNSFIKLAPPLAGSNSLTLLDYFSMYNSVSESSVDQDLGSGGGLLLPDQTDSNGAVRHLIVGAGKDENVYLLDRDNLGKFRSADNSQIWQELVNAFPGTHGVYGAPAYFNGRVYYGAVGDVLRAFSLTNALLSTAAVSQTTTQFPYPGATPSISANGAQNGIVWAVENSGTQGVLHAYDATNLAAELYNSGQAGARDSFGPGSKFNPPTIANGKVYIGTQADLVSNPGSQEGVVVFGAL